MEIGVCSVQVKLQDYWKDKKIVPVVYFEWSEWDLLAFNYRDASEGDMIWEQVITHSLQGWWDWRLFLIRKQ